MAYQILFSAATLVVLIGRIYVPWGRPSTGALVRRERMPLLARLRLHLGPIALALAAATVGAALGWFSPWFPVVVLGVGAAVVCVPVSYTMTTTGIVRGWSRFRRWTEFGGVARRFGGARLQGIAGAPGMTVWLAGGRDADETILLLRQLVRGSYQGHAGDPLTNPNPNAPSLAPLERAGAAGRLAPDRP